MIPLFASNTESRARDCRIMKFKEGNNVEVLRRTKEKCGAWFPGKIISADGDKYTVRYELFLNHEGDPIVENVCRVDVRPQPPPLKGEEKWVLGDIAEVFDLHCWRVGKIAKVLKNNRFVSRLLGSIQLKEFHKSSLRIRQAWHNNKWVVIGKAGGDKLIDNNIIQNGSKYSRALGYGDPQQSIHGETFPRGKGDQEQLKTFPNTSTLQRNLDNHFNSSLNDAVMGLSDRKRKTTIQVGGCVPNPKAKVGKRCMVGSSEMGETEKKNNYSLHPFSIFRVSEESDECSVASCSSTDLPEYTIRNSRKSFRDVADSSFDDAESMCPSVSRRKYLPSCTEDESEAKVHKLELHAYKTTVQALYASGPLSWEQESLLTNLRLSLNISNEEHLLQLRQLLSAQVL